MSKIVDIKTSIVKIALKRTFVTAVRSTNHIDALVVELILDNGIKGYGVAPATTAITGDTLQSMQYITNEIFAPVIKGSNLADYEETLKQAFKRVMFNPAAKMAIDLAFHDLLAKQKNLSVANFLGAKNNIIETDVSISCGTVAETVENVQNGVEANFTAIKVKTGADYNRDIELLKALDNEFDRSIKFRFDANQGWSVAETKQFIEELNKYSLNVEIIEQPVKYYDISAMREITQFSNISIVADESVFDANDAKRVIDERACNMINIKLAKSGGILEAKRIKKLADAAGIPCMVGCMMESPAGILATASFALAENITVADLDPLDWVAKDIYSGYITFNEPNIILKDNLIGFGYNF
ncbi:MULTISPECIES: dipeptide epimerase [unclassified Francisella]|uniref:dipeptide epimerase n=1 Tax=unclassified Francisella TaxID=2610885 RepID=UPI002E362B13|nr:MULTISPECIES: dipeptide epimerase [unclassified Francisella]MED7819698.1 dipeptide epimerase [Francisella sp. 19S2-4]MED7830537.1 dipeptide epimerase [Francisella sp. 19S2-10]